jgi:hypothetical protein
MKYVFLSLLFLSACAKIEVSGELEVRHTLTFSEIRQYFIEHCRILFPDYSEQEIEVCAEQKLKEVFNALR